MTFQVRIEKRPNAFGVDDRVWILDDCAGSFIEIAPGIGFNAYRWHVPEGELLYADPNFFQVHKPTRTGIPILFPFPNRIRDGRFTWEGNTYQLPTNDSSGKNAIHGFVCQRPWRVVDQGADAKTAWVTAEFQGSRDAPETLTLWPADYQIAVTYRFKENQFEVSRGSLESSKARSSLGPGLSPLFLSWTIWRAGNKSEAGRTKDLGISRQFADRPTDRGGYSARFARRPALRGFAVRRCLWRY